MTPQQEALAAALEVHRSRVMYATHHCIAECVPSILAAIVPEDAVVVTRENAWILDRVVAPDLTLAEIREAGSISAARFARLRAAQEETP